MRKLVAVICVICLLLSFTVYAYSSEETKDEVTVENIVDFARKFIGYNYSYGGTGPYSFDCSGFVQYVYSNFGYDIGRTCTDQYYAGEEIDFEDLKPGDILIFANTYEYGISHSGIYIGDNEFIHAANSRKGVCISKLDGYYENHFYAAIRIVEEKNNNDIIELDRRYDTIYNNTKKLLLIMSIQNYDFYDHEIINGIIICCK